MSGTTRYTTRKEAAGRLGVSVRTLDRLCLEGLLRKVPYAGQVRICAASLDAFLASREGPGAGGAAARDAFEAAFPIPWLDERRRLTREKRAAKEQAARETERRQTAARVDAAGLLPAENLREEDVGEEDLGVEDVAAVRPLSLEVAR